MLQRAVKEVIMKKKRTPEELNRVFNLVIQAKKTGLSTKEACEKYGMTTSSYAAKSRRVRLSGQKFQEKRKYKKREPIPQVFTFPIPEIKDDLATVMIVKMPFSQLRELI